MHIFYESFVEGNFRFKPGLVEPKEWLADHIVALLMFVGVIVDAVEQVLDNSLDNALFLLFSGISFVGLQIKPTFGLKSGLSKIVLTEATEIARSKLTT